MFTIAAVSTNVVALPVGTILDRALAQRCVASCLTALPAGDAPRRGPEPQSGIDVPQESGVVPPSFAERRERIGRRG